MNNNCLIIIVYFGTFTETLKKSLYTLTNNKIDVLLFTDEATTLEKKDNLIHHQISNTILKSLVLENMNIIQNFNDYYKLCDFKIFFYHLLKKYATKKYTYVGFCDLDIIFGNLDSFLEKAIKENSHVIGDRGHLMLFKCEYYQRMVHNFLKIKPVIEILESNNNFALDEFKFLHLYLKKEESENKVIWSKEISSKAIDLNYFKENYICVNRNLLLIEYSKDNQDIYVKFENNTKEKISYIHFQKRQIDNCFFKKDELIKINKQSILKDLNKLTLTIIKRIKLKFTKEPIIKKKLLSQSFRDELENLL